MEDILFGMAYECPYGKRKNDCPLKVVDHLSFKEKVDWVMRLKKENSMVILEYHRNCSRRREQ